MSRGRNTTTRDQHRTIIARGKPPCYLQDLNLCRFPGEPIDYEAHHLDPRSFAVDHIDPNGPDTLDNKAATHRACNRDKSNKPLPVMTGGVTFVTERCWWRTARIDSEVSHGMP
ncbi:HNH endonuclease [Mycobacterium sp. E1747]|uniref:HNH endonuclease n=1 Tax=Mycobacterium sp. E1747 TaxID=1834128 RepID=UPI0009ED986E|nr:HNH endonuclease [Mycobacterium sp. E1747]